MAREKDDINITTTTTTPTTAMEQKHTQEIIEIAQMGATINQRQQDEGDCITAQKRKQANKREYCYYCSVLFQQWH